VKTNHPKNLPAIALIVAGLTHRILASILAGNGRETREPMSLSNHTIPIELEARFESQRPINQ
jgi:hypothetical protein